jgi:hypothetical protein
VGMDHGGCRDYNLSDRGLRSQSTARVGGMCRVLWRTAWTDYGRHSFGAGRRVHRIVIELAGETRLFSCAPSKSIVRQASGMRVMIIANDNTLQPYQSLQIITYTPSPFKSIRLNTSSENRHTTRFDPSTSTLPQQTPSNGSLRCPRARPPRPSDPAHYKPG